VRPGTLSVVIVLAGLLLLGVLEIAGMIVVSEATSWIVTLLALTLAGAAGAWVVKREGIATWQRVMSGVRAGQMPTSSLIDGLMVMVAGFLLLVPGFITDVAAVALAVPAVRTAVRTRAADHFQRRIAAQASRARTTVFGFGTSPGFGGFGPGVGNPFGQPDGRRFDDDVIDLDGEEVDVTDDPIAELEPPRDRPA